MTNYKIHIKRWKDKEDLDVSLQKELYSLNEQALQEAFYKYVEFGTGGIRAKMGVGINRLNKYTVRRCALGYANWLLKQDYYNKDKCIVIAYDNRHNAKQFTDEIVSILSSKKIKTAVFKELRSTPQLSYTVRKLNAMGGIVITASHNTKEYNGIKMYDQNGAQCIDSYTKEIKIEIDKIENELLIHGASEDEILKYNSYIKDEIDNQYILESLNIVNREVDYSDTRILYTPQHGTGITTIPKALKELGVNLKLVENQCSIDPDFSCTKTPNPESMDSFIEALKIVNNFNADIIIGTDPDCDRLGVMVKSNDKYIYLTGNQLGAIMLDYYVQCNKVGMIYSTVVTTPLIEKIASTNKITHKQTLTGFKNIGTLLNEAKEPLLIAVEESNGCLISDIVRDKDGLQGVLLTTEMTAFYKKQGKTLCDALEMIYNKYGFIAEKQESISLDGEIGTEKVDQVMSKFRSIGNVLGSSKVYKIEDFKNSVIYKNGKKEILKYPKSNVLKIYFNEFSWIAVRPSGTEPKIKIYYCVETDIKTFKEFNEILKEVNKIIN